MPGPSSGTTARASAWRTPRPAWWTRTGRRCAICTPPEHRCAIGAAPEPGHHERGAPYSVKGCTTHSAWKNARRLVTSPARALLRPGPARRRRTCRARQSGSAVLTCGPREVGIVVAAAVSGAADVDPACRRLRVRDELRAVGEDASHVVRDRVVHFGQIPVGVELAAGAVPPLAVEGERATASHHRELDIAGVVGRPAG